MESMGKKPRPRRSFTPEFKAEIVELCQRGERTVAHQPGRRRAGQRRRRPQPPTGSDLPFGPGPPSTHRLRSRSWHNALAESFFGSIKGELIDLQPWVTRAAARRAVTEYIGWYNGARLHSSLGYLSPAEFEASHRNEIKNVA
jgi:hypothetical protein